jgi:hypothetical protein
MIDNDPASANPKMPPVVAYGSLISFLEHLNTLGGVPNLINPSVYPNSFSGTTVAQIQKALKSFGLVDEQGNPDHVRLEQLIAPGSRKQAFLELLNDKYADLIGLPLIKATPSQVTQWFDRFKMDPDTARKARTFFVHAAKANAIPMSKLLMDKTKVRTQPIRRKKSARSERDTSSTRQNFQDLTTTTNAGTHKTVSLASGGTLTIAVSVDVFSLSAEDRDFVFDLIDKINAYTRGASTLQT